MPRKPSATFTDKELEIMQIVWSRGEATAREIQTELGGIRHYNSVMTIIRVLEKKGHLAHREDGKTYIYRATETQEKAQKNVLGYLINQVFGGSAASLVLNLVETGDLSKNDLDEIRRRMGKTDEKPGGKK
jgi:BlaI family transcriptional regulator, penicillinase repressor